MVMPELSPPVSRPRRFTRRPELVSRAFEIRIDYDLRFTTVPFPRLWLIPCAASNPNAPPAIRR